MSTCLVCGQAHGFAIRHTAEEHLEAKIKAFAKLIEEHIREVHSIRKRLEWLMVQQDDLPKGGADGIRR